MITELTEEQKQWVRDNHEKWTYRRIGEEFQKVWPDSLASFATELEDGTEWIHVPEEEGVWLCKQAGVKE
jgi:hypothetical protein